MAPNGFYIVGSFFWALLAVMTVVNSAMFAYDHLPPIETYIYNLAAFFLIIHGLPVLPWIYLHLASPLLGPIFPSVAQSDESAKRIEDRLTRYSVATLIPYWNWSLGLIVMIVIAGCRGFYDVFFDFENTILKHPILEPCVLHARNYIRTKRGKKPLPPKQTSIPVPTTLPIQQVSSISIGTTTITRPELTRACLIPKVVCEDIKRQRNQLIRDYNKVIKECDEEKLREEEEGEKRARRAAQKIADHYVAELNAERRKHKQTQELLDEANKKIALYLPQANTIEVLQSTLQERERRIVECEASCKQAVQWSDHVKAECDRKEQCSRGKLIHCIKQAKAKINELYAGITAVNRQLQDEKRRCRQLERAVATATAAAPASQALSGVFLPVASITPEPEPEPMSLSTTPLTPVFPAANDSLVEPSYPECMDDVQLTPPTIIPEAPGPAPVFNNVAAAATPTSVFQSVLPTTPISREAVMFDAPDGPQYAFGQGPSLASRISPAPPTPTPARPTSAMDGVRPEPSSKIRKPSPEDSKAPLKAPKTAESRPDGRSVSFPVVSSDPFNTPFPAKPKQVKQPPMNIRIVWK